MGRFKRKKTLPNMTGKQKIKDRNVTLRFTSITGMMRTLGLRKRKMQSQKITKRKKLNRMKRSLWYNCSQKIIKKKQLGKQTIIRNRQLRNKQ